MCQVTSYCSAAGCAVYFDQQTGFSDPIEIPKCPILLVQLRSAGFVNCLPVDGSPLDWALAYHKVQSRLKDQVIALTLCCRMASRALNSKGSECVCEASCRASSRTSQRSNPSPRKSNTKRLWGVTMAFNDCGDTSRGYIEMPSEQKSPKTP